MKGQHGPRDFASVMETRYWLTPAGYAAVETHRQELLTQSEED